MGERAFERGGHREDWSHEADSWRDALRAGAVGFSTSRSEHHETSDDRPGCLTAGVVGRGGRTGRGHGDAGRGIFEGVDSGMSAPDPEVRARALEPDEDAGRRDRVPLTFGLVATSGGRPPA